MKTLLPFVCLLLLPLQLARAQPPPVHMIDRHADTWVATDALGRSVATATTPSPRKNRFVGIFYFLTQGSKEYYSTDDPQHLDYNTYGDNPLVLRDNTKIIARVGGDPVSKPSGWGASGTYWWGEPATGYFLADDPWVAAKNLRMLADAGVDTIIFDVTNGPEYTTALTTVLDTAERMRAAGEPTPQFAFITYSSSGKVANDLYDRIYSKGLYKNLWFRWEGKPLILGDADGSKPDTVPARPEVRAFFTWRRSWANTGGPSGNGKDEWEWADSGDPQRYGWRKDPKRPEEMPVMVGAWATSDIGRSYTGGDQPGSVPGKEPPLNAFDNAAAVDDGLFFAQQWRNAIKVDPKFVWVTGWNEWTAGRQYGPGVPMLGHVTKPGQYFFVDEFNEEFSRDAMPMHGGFGDDYYMQLVENIRRYKGARRPSVTHGFHAIRLGRGFGQWAKIAPIYVGRPDVVGVRDWPGWGGKLYKNSSERNVIVCVKVACDAKNIYFYARTLRALTPRSGKNWMQLAIDADQNPRTGWKGYDFVANSRTLSATVTTLKRLPTGKVSRVSYRAKGNRIEIAIPRSLLGRTNLHQTHFDFHWIDNAPVGSGHIADWWYMGSSAPDGRFNFRYIDSEP